MKYSSRDKRHDVMPTPKIKVYVPEKTFQWRFEATVETYMVF